MKNENIFFTLYKHYLKITRTHSSKIFLTYIFLMYVTTFFRIKQIFVYICINIICKCQLHLPNTQLTNLLIKLWLINEIIFLPTNKKDQVRKEYYDDQARNEYYDEQSPSQLRCGGIIIEIQRGFLTSQVFSFFNLSTRWDLL